MPRGRPAGEPCSWAGIACYEDLYGDDHTAVASCLCHHLLYCLPCLLNHHKTVWDLWQAQVFGTSVKVG